MGFRACDFVEELHTYMFTDQEHDNFVIYQRNVADNGGLEMFMLSFKVCCGSTVRFTKPSVLFDEPRRLAI